MKTASGYIFYLIIKYKFSTDCTARNLQTQAPVISETEPGREEAVVLSKEKDFLICWHPEPQIPYECTQVGFNFFYEIHKNKLEILNSDMF